MTLPETEQLLAVVRQVGFRVQGSGSVAGSGFALGAMTSGRSLQGLLSDGALLTGTDEVIPTPLQQQ